MATFKTPFLLKRGTSSKVDNYAGPSGEVVVDTTNNTLSVQDGNTKGGTRLAKASTQLIAGTGIKITGGTLGANSTISLAPITNSSGQQLAASTYGQATNAAPQAGGTINVPYIVVDNAGRISSVGSSTVTLPSGGGSSSVSYADTAGSANSATTATKATQDGDGNVITSTYAKKTEVPLVYTSIYMSPSGNDANDGSTSAKAIKTFARLSEILSKANNSGLLESFVSFGNQYTSIVQVIISAGTYDGSQGVHIHSSNNLAFIPLGSVTISGNSETFLRFVNTYLNFGGVNGSYNDNGTVKTIPSNGAFILQGACHFEQGSFFFNCPVTFSSSVTTSNAFLQFINKVTQTASSAFEISNSSWCAFMGQFTVSLGHIYCHANSYIFVDSEVSITVNDGLRCLSSSTINCIASMTIKRTNAERSFYGFINASLSSFIRLSNVTLSSSLDLSSISNSFICAATYMSKIHIIGVLEITSLAGVDYCLYLTGNSVGIINAINCSAANANKITKKYYLGVGCQVFQCRPDQEFVASSNTNKGLPGVATGNDQLGVTYSSVFRAAVTEKSDLGTASYRWRNLYIVNDPNTKSDSRDKYDVVSIPDNILDAWDELKLYKFKFKDKLSDREHFGLIAQDVQAIFQKHNIDPTLYSFFCYDKWDDEYEEGEDGQKTLVKEAGDMYSLRYTEALVIEAAYQRRRADRLEARLAAIEQRLGI